MRTLGIDLAAQDKKTATCAIEWTSEGAQVELPDVARCRDRPYADAGGRAARGRAARGLDSPALARQHRQAGG
jgi:hypothetical protein